MIMVNQRLWKLRMKMKEAGVQYCVIPTSDDHHSESVSEFFMLRQYLSGFTGSAGTLVVTPDEAALFTDGRYFIQAKAELYGTDIQLMKMGEPSVPTVNEYIGQKVQKGEIVGFDGRVMTYEAGKQLQEMVHQKGGALNWQFDPANGVWENRPELHHHPIWELPEAETGESAADKLARVREEMKKQNVQVHILTSLDDIAWLYNIRSHDVECCPVALAYTVITSKRAFLFAKEGFQGTEGAAVSAKLQQSGVEIDSYGNFYDRLLSCCRQEERKECRILLDQQQINYRVMMELQKESAESRSKAAVLVSTPKLTMINHRNPTAFMKAVKNETELVHIRNAHLKDAVAMTKFMYWLKQNVGKVPMDECSVAEYADWQRKQQEGFLELSFPTISAYGTNGAIIHYHAQKGSCAVLKPEGMLMIDSGGHYIDGTTDITRTFILGPVTSKMKEHYTLVLRAMLSLRATKFLYGCTGENLDIRAREILWEHGLDYKHGTGHGIGNLLNVHEGPQSFRWKHQKGTRDAAVLEEGMITSDEPGIYLENQYGIRIENELLCRKGVQNEYGQFMYFEDLTFVPIDLDGVESSQMSTVDKERLNGYHQMVYEKLEPYFEGEQKEWLKFVTRAI